MNGLKDLLTDQWNHGGVIPVWALVLFGMLLIPVLLQQFLLPGLALALLKLSHAVGWRPTLPAFAVEFVWWLPILSGVFACLLLPTATILPRVAIAIAYALVMTGLLGFVQLMKGCLLYGECL